MRSSTGRGLSIVMFMVAATALNPGSGGPAMAQTSPAVPATAAPRTSPLDIGAAAFLRGDYATALAAWRGLADAGDARAQGDLGILYANGFGVRQDVAEAVRWYRMGAEKGDPGAQSNLANAYLIGMGMRQDATEARAWYRRAADQGNADAQFSLGALYDKGQGGPTDYPTALRWYRQAAAQGHAAAEGNIGSMFALGHGVPTDLVAAYLWFNRAALTTGDAHMRSVQEANRRLAVQKMTPAQISEAGRRVQETLPLP